ncbi:SRPBCC family protein [Aeromicrobium camelliae]|uniref:SRPBCC family protein n=1 Tax=Aeromicrobium camelliae TaxID=1538144 RepID=A0A3N6Z888_9ACTN|nr:SRPBCC family protein [Aeromicrobium camelliae]RQN03157.1 SRPBCC family protein [Aeromicrobium camelliae]
MARTESDIVIAAPASTVMAVIADFESYPSWATGMQEVTVLKAGDDGRAEEVRFLLAAPPIRDEFTLGYRWEGDDAVSWSMVGDASMLTAMDGAYRLDRVAADTTRVTYQLRVDVSVPLLGMLKRKAEKVIVDTALKGLKKRVESVDV